MELRFSEFLLLKRLNVDIDYFHRYLKPLIRKNFKDELIQFGCTNPDIGYNPETGNIAFQNPENKQTFETNIPLSEYEEY